MYKNLHIKHIKNYRKTPTCPREKRKNPIFFKLLTIFANLNTKFDKNTKITDFSTKVGNK
eukprot:Pgem_evm1s13630